jgi:hypothetical protein
MEPVVLKTASEAKKPVKPKPADKPIDKLNEKPAEKKADTPKSEVPQL